MASTSAAGLPNFEMYTRALTVTGILRNVEELIRQIRAAADAGLYYLALFGVLALPDICGALGSENGKASGAKFKVWLRDNVPEQAADADIIYGLRCSLLHQGKTLPHGGHFPMAFTLPGTAQLHNISTVVGNDQVGWSSVSLLVQEVTRGAESWLNMFGETALVTKNMEKFARLRPEGLPPHVNGPVVA